jgi:hypothetical protein
MTDIAITSPVERIARVLAAEALSPNGEGPDWSDGPIASEVDRTWRHETGRALAVLKTLREATQEMIDAGRGAGDDPAEIWSAMVRAAIDQRMEQPGA